MSQLEQRPADQRVEPVNAPKRFDFASPEGALISISIDAASAPDGPLGMKGPHGLDYELEIQDLPSEHAHVLEKILRTNDLRELSAHEVAAVADARAIIRNRAEPLGFLVRFNCSWFRID